jgi:carbon storage regulator CsrA
MLVLYRKKRQTIRIGGNVTITVMDTCQGTVRIGIDAPDDVIILRGELDNPNYRIVGKNASKGDRRPPRRPRRDGK